MFKSIPNRKYNNYLEKKEINADSLKEITKYKKVILKTQHCFTFKWWQKNTVNWFDRNICTWNDQRSYFQERKN